MLPDYTRVTDVLRPFSGLDFVKPEVLNAACLRGTHVHEATDAIIYESGKIVRTNLGTIIKKQKDNFVVKEECEKYIESLCFWLQGKLFIKKPERFYCDQYMITGECDALYEDDNGLTLVDFKTPVKESKTWGLQGSAYSYLAKKNGYPINRIEFVKLCKEGKEPKVFVYEEDFGTFLSCLEVYNYFYKNKKNIIQDEDL